MNYNLPRRATVVTQQLEGNPDLNNAEKENGNDDKLWLRMNPSSVGRTRAAVEEKWREEVNKELIDPMT